VQQTFEDAMTIANPLMSMTAFASRKGDGAGALQGLSWVWEIRCVNGKGFDLRLRLPDGIDGLEARVRSDLGARVRRGSVSLGLKITREIGAEGLQVQPAGVQAALAALAEVTAQAKTRGLVLAPPTAAEVLALRGVAETRARDEETPPELLTALMRDFAQLLDEFDTMRASEGAALGRILSAQLDQIATLLADARPEADARRARMAETLAENMKRALGAFEADPQRLAQELALLAVKADVAEELDRLDAHVAAARALLAGPGPVGRKLDFLTQEFNREANTLCSKAGALRLTQIGLDLKHVIDQMREQVQNLE